MPLLTNQTDLLFDRDEFSEDAQYYLASKLQSEYFTGGFRERAAAWERDPSQVAKSFSAYKDYPGKKRFALTPDLKSFRKINWEESVLRRASRRGFDGESISLTELSNLILLCFGLKEQGKWLKAPRDKKHWPSRALPSGGKLYPLELYVLALNVQGLPRGLYHYTALRGSLSQLRTDLPETDTFLAQKNLFQNPPVIFFMTSVFNRSRVKYGARALRYILLEAGGIGAHMNLVANAMDLDFCLDGGGFEDKIEELIGIDGKREGHILTMMAGHTQ